MVLGSPFPDVLMSSIAEWSIGRHLTVAELEVAWLAHVEGHRTASGDHPLTLTIAKRVDLTCSAWAPIVSLTLLQVHVGWEDTCVHWHAWWSISALLVWSALAKINDCLSWEVCYIVHSLDFSLLLDWLDKLWLWHQNVSLVGSHLATDRTINNNIMLATSHHSELADFNTYSTLI